MVKMSLSASKSQASSVSTLVENYGKGMGSIKNALSSLSGNSELSGQAYKSIKSYGETVVTPLIEAYELYADAVGKDTKKLPDKFENDVGADDDPLDSDELQAKIDAKKASIKSMQSQLDGLNKKDKPSSSEKSTISSLNSKIGTANDDLEKLEEKKRKFLAYNSDSASFFSDISEIEGALTSGLKTLSVGIGSFSSSKGFSMPSKKDLEWQKKLEHYKATKKSSKEEALKSAADYARKHAGETIIDLLAGKKHFSKHVKNAIKEMAKKKAKEVLKKGAKVAKAKGSAIKKDLQHKPKHKAGGPKHKAKSPSKIKKAGNWLSDKFSKWGNKAKNIGDKIAKSKLGGKLAKWSGKAKKLIKRVGDSKLGKVGGKIAKWGGKAFTAFSTLKDGYDSFGNYKKQGYSNTQAAGMATRRAAVNAAATAGGEKVGEVIGGAFASVIPIPGATIVGAIVGGYLGGIAGSAIGSAVNNEIDKHEKPHK